MDSPLQTRCKNMILGALVADAAAMGLHWIYDQPRILSIGAQAPEFQMPDPANYTDVPAYFAHQARPLGATSQYGEQAMVMLRTLVTSGGQYDAADYAQNFRTHFGYGGAYVGYIDHATRDTLDNHLRNTDAAYAIVQSEAFASDPTLRKALVAIALPLLARHEGADLARRYAAALAPRALDADGIDFALKLLRALEEIPLPTGASDIQLPAIAKLPPLVAALAAQGITSGAAFEKPIVSAIRTTSDHPEALVYGMISAKMMLAALTEGTREAVVTAAHKAADGIPAARLSEVSTMLENPNTEVARHFGMACNLSSGVPVALHAILTANSFTQAVRMNIHSGGDSCGRAMLLGAVTGAIHGADPENGIPLDWANRTLALQEAQDSLATLIC